MRCDCGGRVLQQGYLWKAVGPYSDEERGLRDEVSAGQQPWPQEALSQAREEGGKELTPPTTFHYYCV